MQRWIHKRSSRERSNVPVANILYASMLNVTVCAQVGVKYNLTARAGRIRLEQSYMTVGPSSNIME